MSPTLHGIHECHGEVVPGKGRGPDTYKMITFCHPNENMHCKLHSICLKEKIVKDHVSMRILVAKRVRQQNE